jgi:hypothetical protein
MGKTLEFGSGMNNPDHISESLETVVQVKLKILKFFDADPEFFYPGWEKIEWVINISDPRH